MYFILIYTNYLYFIILIYNMLLFKIPLKS